MMEITMIQKIIQAIGEPSNTEAFVTRRLEETDRSQLLSRWSDEHPIDAVIILLNNRDSYPVYVENAIKACKKIFSNLICWISDPDSSIDSQQRITLENLCNLIVNAIPIEFEDKTRTLLSEAIDNPVFYTATDIVYRILSSFRSYKRSTDDMPLLSKLIEKPDFAAAAFQIMLEIKSNDYGLRTQLFQLWIRSFEGENIDALSLTISFHEKINKNDSVIKEIFNLLKNKRPDVYDSAVNEIKDFAKFSKNTKLLIWLEQETAPEVVPPDYYLPLSVGVGYKKGVKTFVKPWIVSQIESQPNKEQNLQRSLFRIFSKAQQGSKIIENHKESKYDAIGFRNGLLNSIRMQQTINPQNEIVAIYDYLESLQSKQSGVFTSVHNTYSGKEQAGTVKAHDKH